jgi:hypothetical protein
MVQGLETGGGGPIVPGAPGSAGIRSAMERPVEFDSILRKARGAQDAKSQARQAAEEFVAQSLVLPILKSIREQNQAAPPFGPGPYEQNIGSLFDMEVATRLVKAQRFPIVDAVARNLLREKATAPSAIGAKEQGGSNGDSNGPTTGIQDSEERTA